MTPSQKSAEQRTMIGIDALGNGNDHFGLHEENNFCRQRGCVEAPRNNRSWPGGGIESFSEGDEP